MIDFAAQALNRFRLLKRFKPRSLTRLERHMLAERIRNNQNIGKQDRGVESKATNGLQGHFCRKLRIEA